MSLTAPPSLAPAGSPPDSRSNPPGGQISRTQPRPPGGRDPLLDLSPVMRRCLVEHIAGPQPIVHGPSATVRALRGRGYLRLDQRKPPRVSILAQAGREIAARCLALEAEALNDG